MTFWSRVRSFFRSMTHREELASEMDTELRFHMDTYVEDLMRSGVSREEAMRRARLEFGGVDKAKEECLDATGANLLETFLQDLRFGARSMLRAPGFTVVAVLALALGIGANAAIFSVVNAVLLRPLAYNDSDRLVTILHTEFGPVSPANFVDWQAQAKSFESMGAAEMKSVNLTNVDAPEHVNGLRVSQSIFPMLGVQPVVGRWFLPGEDKAGADHVVVLSYRFWQRHFGGDSKLIGKAMTLDGESYTIVGVMPQGFVFAPYWSTNSELWFPFVLHDLTDRSFNSTRVFARLAPGATIGKARAEMATITRRLDAAFPGTNSDITVTRLKEKVVGKVEAPLLILLAAVGLVLLIACANVAHMLLARAAARQREFAVRTAIGASRGRLIRQFLTENLLLSAMGGAAGLLLSIWGTRALVALAPSGLPRLDSVAIDGRVVGFLIAVTALCSIAFGFAPAIQASSVNLADSLKESGRGTSDGIGRNRMRSVLVISEFALALLLLVGAGLLARSFAALRSVDPGFDPHHVLSMVVSVAGSAEAAPGAREAFYRNVLNRIRALPGVESAGAINHLPIQGDEWGWGYLVAGKPVPAPQDMPSAVYRIAASGYFEAMRIPIVMGRAIDASDTMAAQHVAVVNEKFAHDVWPGESPLGKRVTFDTATDQRDWLTVVGVTKNVTQSDWAVPIAPEIYSAALQNFKFLGETDSSISYITLVVRTAGDPAAMAKSVKSTVWSFDHNLPISEVVTMDGVVAEATAQPRFEMLLLGVFAAVALALAAVGIYGVMSYSVSRRTHEIGIRVSLGATRAQILALVLRQGLILAVTGLAIGVIGAMFLSRLMAGLLYGVQPTDPVTYIGVGALLLLVAVAAAYVPARRAMRVDPIVALRYE
jgi:putative ABC transport system permease protein